MISSKFLHCDNQYLKLVNTILRYGEWKKGRNANTLSYFGYKMRFCLKDNKVPFLTTKKLAWKSCLKELLWFINGQTDNKILTNQNVSIWNGNASKDFLFSRGLSYPIEGDLGPVYGHQWRHFNAKYNDCNTNYTGKGVDQLKYVIENLNNEEEKFSRRLILSAWNPQQLDEMALPPCHVMSQFNVSPSNELSCLVFQRSGDVGLGVPFNIASYGMLTHLLAKHCNLKVGSLVHILGDAHIYENHIDALKKQRTRDFYDMPTININKKTNIDDYIFSDFKIMNYKFHPTIKMDMIA